MSNINFSFIDDDPDREEKIKSHLRGIGERIHDLEAQLPSVDASGKNASAQERALSFLQECLDEARAWERLLIRARSVASAIAVVEVARHVQVLFYSSRKALEIFSAMSKASSEDELRSLRDTLEEEEKKVRSQRNALYQSVYEPLFLGAALSASREGFDAARDDLSGEVRETKLLREQIIPMKAALEQALEKEAARLATQDFSDIEKKHKIAARWYGGAFAVLATAILIVIKIPVEVHDTLYPQLAAALPRVVLLAVLLVILRVIYRRWSLERHLQIVYKHRQIALRQHNILKGGIPPEDVDAQNALRLELVRLIFADPKTGFLDERGSEFSVNPIVAIGERMLTGSQKSS